MRVLSFRCERCCVDAQYCTAAHGDRSPREMTQLRIDHARERRNI